MFELTVPDLYLGLFVSFNLMTSNGTQNNNEQERIPVGCVPSAAVAVSGGVYLLEGISAQGGDVCQGESARYPLPWTE